MRVDDPNDLGRVAWGAKRQQRELMTYLEPYLKSKDDTTREKAEILQKIFTRRLEAFRWATEQARLRAEEKYTGELPRIKESLLSGDSQERKETLTLIARERIMLIMDDSFLEAFAACAMDEDRSVRNSVARGVGGRWIWSAESQNADAIELMLQLSEDKDREVRYNAVYFGLSTVREKEERVVKRLLEMAFSDREPNLYGRIGWGLRGSRETAAQLLDEYIAGPDPTAAKAAREVYRDMTGQQPQ